MITQAQRLEVVVNLVVLVQGSRAHGRDLAVHWWGRGKPWARFTPRRVTSTTYDLGAHVSLPDVSWSEGRLAMQLGAAYGYLKHSLLLRRDDEEEPVGECTRTLWRVRRAIELDPRFESFTPRDPGPYFPVW